MCREGCPVYEVLRFETVAARGRYMLIRGLLEQRYGINETVRKRAYQCMLCGYCLYRCATQTTDAFIALRADVVEAGFTIPEIDRMVRSLVHYGNPFFQEKPKPQLAPRSGSVLFFVGCTYAYIAPKDAQKAATLLLRIGYPIFQRRDEPCCGQVLHLYGYLRDQAAFEERLAAWLSDTGADLIITACPGCYSALKRLEERGQAPHTLHLVEAVLEAQPRFHPLKLRVTWHDPCHLVRMHRMPELPRQLLHQIPNLRFEEMPRHGYNARCCGGPALFYDPELMLEIADRRLSEATSLAVRYLVTSCPLCEYALRKANRILNKRRVILPVQDLLLRALA